MYYVRFREYNGNGTNYQTDYFKSEDFSIIEKVHKKRQMYHVSMPGSGYSELTDLTMNFHIDKFLFELVKKEIPNLFKLNVIKYNRDYCISNNLEYDKIKVFQKNAIKEINQKKYNGNNDVISRLFLKIESDKITNVSFKLKLNRYKVIGAESCSGDKFVIIFTDKQKTLLESLKRLDRNIFEYYNYKTLS
jgi:hypothetical protein